MAPAGVHGGDEKKVVSAGSWRSRLREAVERTGRKHAAIAWESGIAPGTLSRILTGKIQHPSLPVIVRLAQTCGETVGWLLGERTYQLSAEDRRRIRTAAAILDRVTRE